MKNQNEADELINHAEDLAYYCLEKLLELVKKHHLNDVDVCMVFAGTIALSLKTLFKNFIKKLDVKTEALLKKKVFDEFEWLFKTLKEEYNNEN